MFRRRRPPAPPTPRPRQAPAPARRLDDWRSYDDVADLYERTRAPIHEAPARDLVSRIEPPEGGRFLDVGTGTGVAAQAARAAVGSEGLVVGIDPSVEMLRRARRRGVLTVAGEAIDLPFADGTFHAVSASFVIFLFQRYETGLFDMVRVLRPGGRLGVTTWANRNDEFAKTWRDTAESFTGPQLLRDAVARAAPWEERFSRPEALEQALRDAGLRPVEVERRQYRHTVAVEDYLQGRETSAMGRYLRATLGEALWDRFRERTREEFRRRFPDPLGDTSDVLIAVGTKG